MALKGEQRSLTLPNDCPIITWSPLTVFLCSVFSLFSDKTYSLAQGFPQTEGRLRTRWGEDHRALLRFALRSGFSAGLAPARGGLGLVLPARLLTRDGTAPSSLCGNGQMRVQTVGEEVPGGLCAAEPGAQSSTGLCSSSAPPPWGPLRSLILLLARPGSASVCAQFCHVLAGTGITYWRRRAV